MSAITPIDPQREAEQNWFERKRDEIDSEQAKTDEQQVVPSVRAAAEKQDQKTLIQGFQHTGKGSFIDKVF